MKTPKITALNLKPAQLDAETKAYFDKCTQKLGFIPNVLLAYAHNLEKLKAFAGMYNELMLGKSNLSKLDREMIAVVVSSINHCYYCLTAHGQTVRQLSNDPILGEQLVMNYRVATLTDKQRAMLDFTSLITESPSLIEESDRENLREVGFSDQDIWDISATASFFNMSNRMSTAVDLQPNLNYHGLNR